MTQKHTHDMGLGDPSYAQALLDWFRRVITLKSTLFSTFTLALCVGFET